MTVLTVTPADVRPLHGAVVQRANAAEAMTVGDLVYVFGETSDGAIPTVKKSAGGALATCNVFGMVVAGSVSKNGSTTIASGDEGIDVVIFGPVTGFSGATAGGFVWASDTAGKADDAVGTKSCIVGKMQTSTILLINPMQAVRSA